MSEPWQIEQAARCGCKGTHALGCHTWGPRHYECALARLAEAEGVLNEIADDPLDQPASWGVKARELRDKALRGLGRT
jgi:hypothetical protein